MSEKPENEEEYFEYEKEGVIDYIPKRQEVYIDLINGDRIIQWFSTNLSNKIYYEHYIQMIKWTIQFYIDYYGENIKSITTFGKFNPWISFRCGNEDEWYDSWLNDIAERIFYGIQMLWVHICDWSL